MALRLCTRALKRHVSRTDLRCLALVLLLLLLCSAAASEEIDARSSPLSSSPAQFGNGFDCVSGASQCQQLMKFNDGMTKVLATDGFVFVTGWGSIGTYRCEQDKADTCTKFFDESGTMAKLSPGLILLSTRTVIKRCSTLVKDSCTALYTVNDVKDKRWAGAEFSRNAIAAADNYIYTSIFYSNRGTAYRDFLKSDIMRCRVEPANLCETVFTAKDIEAWSMTYGAGTLYVGYQGKNSLQSRGGILMCPTNAGNMTCSTDNAGDTGATTPTSLLVADDKLFAGMANGWLLRCDLLGPCKIFDTVAKMIQNMVQLQPSILYASNTDGILKCGTDKADNCTLIVKLNNQQRGPVQRSYETLTIGGLSGAVTPSGDGSLFAEYIYSFNPKINSRRRFESVLYKVVPTP